MTLEGFIKEVEVNRSTYFLNNYFTDIYFLEKI